MRRLRRLALIAACGLAALGVPAGAQDNEEGPGPDGESASGSEFSRERRRAIDPYIEVAQVFTWQFAPIDETVTYTKVAAGVDATFAGRNNGATVSVRYERNLAWSEGRSDEDLITGLARAYGSIVPNTLTVEAGALANRTRIDGAGTILTPGIDEDITTQTFAAYAGPNLTTRAGPVEIAATYRLGYARVDAPDRVTAGGTAVDVFDESVTHAASVRAGTSPGEPLPVGVGVGAGFFQEDVDNLDQRVRDAYVRGDVTVPINAALAVVGGVGIEDVEVSSRDAVRGPGGLPIVGPDGRYVTDPASPRRIAYEADGLIWDVGVIWRPSRRTALEAHFGHRYDSETFYGSFTWQPSRRSSVAIGVYDGISGFGGRLTNALSVLPTDFQIIRDPVTGQITGCLTPQGTSCLDGLLLNSVRSAAFRSRGVAASYSRDIGNWKVSFGAGYDNRRFFAAPGTVLAPADGVTDETWYASAAIGGQFSPRSYAGAEAEVSWFESGSGTLGDVTAMTATGYYSYRVFTNLSARAALALARIDSGLTARDVATATALVGLRYDF